MWMTCLAVKVDRRKATSLCRRQGRLLEPQQSLMPRTPGTGFWTSWDWSNRHVELTHLTDPGEAASDMPPLAAPQDEVLPVFPAFVCVEVCVGRFTVVSPKWMGSPRAAETGLKPGSVVTPGTTWRELASSAPAAPSLILVLSFR